MCIRDSPRAEQRQYIWRFEQDWFKLADTMLRHPDTLNAAEKKKAQQQLKDTLVSLTPVSYTHLDVYKRQLHRCDQCRASSSDW